MDSPGHDGEVVTSFVGGSAQIVVFTTGRGTPTGFPNCSYSISNRQCLYI